MRSGHNPFLRPAFWIAILHLFLAFARADGQPPAGSGETVPPRGRPPMSLQERRDRIRMVRTWRLIDVLELQSTQSDRFFLALKRYDAEEDRISQARERVSASLKAMLDDPELGEKAVVDTMQAIRRQDLLLQEARNRLHAETSQVLSLRQQAKLLLFEQRFDTILRDTIVEVMLRRSEGGGWRNPGPWGTPERWRTP